MKFFFFLIFCSALYASDMSFMPRLFNTDSAISLPKEPGEILDSSLRYFKQFPLDSGKTCPKNGILISDKTAAEYIFYKLGYERQGVELRMSKYLLKEYYDKALTAEKIYQDRIEVLEKENKRSWLERNQIYFGFILGIAMTVATEYVVFQAK